MEKIGVYLDDIYGITVVETVITFRWYAFLVIDKGNMMFRIPGKNFGNSQRSHSAKQRITDFPN